jgi:iron complex transport system ATP-binding protein
MNGTQNLILHDIHAGYRGKPVLSGICLSDIKPGEILALTGPNAAGKSTVLKAIAGFIPVRGTIMLGTEKLTGMKPFERAGKVSYMPQALPRGVGLSVFESVLSALRIAGSRKTVNASVPLERQAAALIEKLRLSDIALSNIDTLSGGQRQMAALAQALVGSPSVLLLDEPTSALDLRHQDEFMRTIQGIAASGTIVIVILHELSLAARMADRLVVLSQGRVAADGKPETVLNSETLAKVWGINAEVTLNSRGSLLIDVLGPARDLIRKESR